MNLLAKFLSIIILFLSIGCDSKFAEYLPERPLHKMDDSILRGSPEFKQGWHDGCHTGMASGSNTFYKMFYRSRTIDGYKMAYSPEYKTAWGNAYWYCYRHDYIKQKSSVWGSIFSGVI